VAVIYWSKLCIRPVQQGCQDAGGKHYFPGAAGPHLTHQRRCDEERQSLRAIYGYDPYLRREQIIKMQNYNPYHIAPVDLAFSLRV
jgi:hypothetical protein